MSETPTETKEWTFDLVWEDFVAQLLAAREEVKTKEDELEKNSSLMTRIDLTEINEARTKVQRLEGACEALDIVRTQVIGADSLIKHEETTA
jgi:hypothetical protein|tara:strand:+ start:1254 stop:1529 length:276 start_codon:yes stop_codon:yes gene_type:complete